MMSFGADRLFTVFRVFAASLTILAGACSANNNDAAISSDLAPVTAVASPTTTPTAPSAEHDIDYSPMASSQAPSANLAEQPVANGGPFGEPSSFPVDPESVRIDLAVVGDDLYISVGTPQDSYLTRATLANGVITYGPSVPWPTAGADPVFGLSNSELGLVTLPGRTPLTGAVPFAEGWAWVSGANLAIGVPTSFIETPLNLLPDTLLVTDGEIVVALIDPVTRLNHGIVGDTIESAGFAVVNSDGTIRSQITLDDPDVVEGRSAMLADVTGDGRTEIVVTLANADIGAWIAVFDLDGTLIGESAAIGLGNRWRHQLAVVADPDGPLMLNVITPHIGGTLQALRLVEGRLESVATRRRYSPHAINSRILDGAYVGDLDGDGDWEVLLPNQARTQLVALSLSNGEFTEEFVLENLDGARLQSNIAVIDWSGRTVVATVDTNSLATLWTTNG